MTELILVRTGLAIFALLGTVHLVYSLLDLVKPRRFAPADAALLPAMKATRIRMRKHVRNFWRSYMGFHFSHSLGLLLFAAMYFSLSLHAPELLFAAPFAQIMIGASLVYAILAHFFWFSIPFWGSVMSLALFVIAVAMQG